VTSENDLQAGLDLRPDDHHLRRVLGDYLEEQGDERATGYRALGVNRKQPQPYDDENNGTDAQSVDHWSWWDDLGGIDTSTHDLFRDWFRLLKRGTGESYYRNYATRRQAEDDAARAFLTLPVERQAELLKPPAAG